MPTFTKETQVDAPKERVWEVLAELGSISKWNPSVSYSRSTSENGSGEGATRHCDLQGPGGKRIGYLEERAFDWREGEGFKIELYDTNLPLRTNTVAFLLEGDGHGTIVRVSPEYEVKYGPLGKIADVLLGRRQFERGMERLLAGLKHYVETGEEIADRGPDEGS